MKKAEFSLLEKVYAAEVDSALTGRPDVVQARGKVAQALEEQGMIQRATRELGGRLPMTVDGFVLTDLGRLTYCTSC